MRTTNTDLYKKIVAKWDELSANPENRYLRPTPKANMIAVSLGVSYPTVIKALVSAGRYEKK